ncbi:hypothetical protein K6119_04240 [Paracrocinitomix mangrovi]|uniref:hypothetical protein n=1 Tax=Paracrocinitomix mangrovi TaxID=2862509 RepID=UPI001C8D0315|nr:hypothetical protein [Paracrocinitomix mangrovi]UKN02723.1 hypothetical protein K6119_04240 [Paracrocinitomix mangrovi]
MKLLTTIFTVLSLSLSFSQNEFEDTVNSKVLMIENLNLSSDTIFWEELSDHMPALDGGAELIIYYTSEFKKIKIQLGLSNGIRTITLFLENSVPIKFIDIEERFVFDQEKSELNYTKTDTISNCEGYILSWENGSSKTTCTSIKRQETLLYQTEDYYYILELAKIFKPKFK